MSFIPYIFKILVSRYEGKQRIAAAWQDGERAPAVEADKFTVKINHVKPPEPPTPRHNRPRNDQS
jgi:hypothetical protein